MSKSSNVSLSSRFSALGGTPGLFPSCQVAWFGISKARALQGFLTGQSRRSGCRAMPGLSTFNHSGKLGKTGKIGKMVWLFCFVLRHFELMLAVLRWFCATLQWVQPFGAVLRCSAPPKHHSALCRARSALPPVVLRRSAPT